MQFQNERRSYHITKKQAAMADSKKDSKQQKNDMDVVFHELGGSSGRFQIFNYVLLSIPFMIVGYIIHGFVFTTLPVDYRCAIPECENVNDTEYYTAWMNSAIPYANSKYSKCQRYAPLNVSLEGRCDATSFDQSHIIPCDANELIYRTDEISIENAFGNPCDGNAQLKLSLIGSVNSVSRLFVLPLIGIFGDRYGRQKVLLFGTICTGVVGLLQSFATNYLTFSMLEFIVGAGIAALFQPMLVLSLEWATASNRNTVMQLLLLPQYVTALSTALVAAYAHNFRLYMRFLYVPTLLSVIFVYFVPESFRWLLAKQERDRTWNMIGTITRMNRSELSAKSEEIINRKLSKAEEATATPETPDKDNKKNDPQTLRALFTCRPLLIRFIICIFCWMGIAYVNQGSIIMSVFLRGDKYQNYILISLAGFPSTIISIVLLKYVGRRKSMVIFLLLVSISTAIANSLPDAYYHYSLALFLFAKCFSLLAHLTLYLQGVELWPTPLRQTLVGFCSTAGRVGSTLSPLAPLLTNISEMLPFWTFAIVSLIAGMLCLFLPETLNKELPDTIEQAARLDKKN